MRQSNVWVLSIVSTREQEGGQVMGVFDDLQRALEHRRTHTYQLIMGEMVIVEGLVLNEPDYEPEAVNDPLYVQPPSDG